MGHAARQTGTVRRLFLDKGYGFIQAGTVDYFFHRSATSPGVFDTLREGQEVTFLLGADPRGKGPRAEMVEEVD